MVIRLLCIHNSVSAGVCLRNPKIKLHLQKNFQVDVWKSINIWPEGPDFNRMFLLAEPEIKFIDIEGLFTKTWIWFFF